MDKQSVKLFQGIRSRVNKMKLRGSGSLEAGLILLGIMMGNLLDLSGSGSKQKIFLDLL